MRVAEDITPDSLVARLAKGEEAEDLSDWDELTKLIEKSDLSHWGANPI
ncbi:MAG: hypothetical protein Alpg2KO_11560 [Alphaproteobacteria bacterium]